MKGNKAIWVVLLMVAVAAAGAVTWYVLRDEQPAQEQPEQDEVETGVTTSDGFSTDAVIFMEDEMPEADPMIVGKWQSSDNPQWYKVYYQRDDFANITDKYLFKNYVKEKLGPGHTIPIYNVWTDIGDLERDWHSLPEEFVLKANLQSDGRNIMFVHHKSQTDFRRIRPELKRWLKVWDTLLNSWEWHFYNSTPRILAEKYMSNIEGQLYDYKIYCFDGEPYCMYVAQEHFVDNNSYPITFYDLDWKKIDICYGSHRNADAAKPKHFAEMVEMARILSKGFPFIRVDFFDTDETPYVAEMTFTPGGGCVPYSPESFNRLLGDKLILKSFPH